MTKMRDQPPGLFVTVLVWILDRVTRLRCGMRWGGHTDELKFGPSRLYLRCVDCGRETPGFVIARGDVC